MPGGIGVEGLVEHQRGVAEAGLDVAVLPPGAGLAQRQHAVAGGSEEVGGPLHRGHLAVHEGVALLAGVGAAGPQAGDRIDDERQRVHVHRDGLDSFGGGPFVHRGHRQHRLALVDRLVGERALRRQPARRRGHRRQIVGGQHRPHARNRQRRRGVDAADAAVRHRAQQQLAEQHAFRAVVLGVAGPAGDFRHQVRRRVVLPDEPALCHVSSRTSLLVRAAARRSIAGRPGGRLVSRR